MKNDFQLWYSKYIHNNKIIIQKQVRIFSNTGFIFRLYVYSLSSTSGIFIQTYIYINGIQYF